MDNSLLLKLSKLSFQWSGQNEMLFGPIEMEFLPGTITTVLGPNGSGKTTILNIIAGRILPSSGDVLIANRAASKDDFNYMLQDSARLLFSHLTLRENLLIGRGHEQINTALKRVISILFPDADVLDKYPNECSGGQRQRAVLCRAIVDIERFPVTLLDEPLSQVSQDIKPHVYELIREIVKKSNRVVLMVTHDISEALIIGNSTMVLSQGTPIVFDTSCVTDAITLVKAGTLRERVQRAILGVLNSNENV